MIDYIALSIALSVSAVSGYYSIIGLTTIFSASFWPVVVMGCVLEAGKLVSASWLYRNWKTAPLFLKSYLTLAVVVLMLITSMGIFGFLSKAHIDQQINITTGNADKVLVINNKIDVETQTIKDIDLQISQIDNAVTKMTDKGQAQSSLNAADRQRKLRDDLTKQKNAHVDTLSKLKEEKIPLESSLKKMEAEVGPIKYIAQLLFTDAGSENLERAIRGVILLLVIVFDPLAVVLLIAANSGLARNQVEEEVRPKKKQLTNKPKRDNILKIDNNNITQFIDKEKP
jgi:hypothetical protein